MPNKQTFSGVFDEILDLAHKRGVRWGSEHSLFWFRDHLDRLLDDNDSINGSHLISSAINRTENVFLMGKVILFQYDPKGKADLAYYDIFPLVIPVAKYKDGWLGINLHYVDIPVRMFIVNELSRNLSDRNYDDNTRFMLNWNTIQRSRAYPQIVPCLKRYLVSNLKSRLLPLNPKELSAAIFLPVANFKKVKAKQVHQEARRKIRTIKRGLG